MKIIMSLIMLITFVLLFVTSFPAPVRAMDRGGSRDVGARAGFGLSRAKHSSRPSNYFNPPNHIFTHTSAFSGPVLVGACEAKELKPCLVAITGGGKPSGECCKMLKEQEPCLCGYIKNPSLVKYITSPNARKVLAACSIPYPTC